MALGATMYHVEVALSDVDRSVYETLDLRLARHPSESMRYMLTRLLAYCLSYEDGIQFSKGGLSQVDEPPVSVVDPTGLLLAWIDVGSPSAERLHRAAKAARRVSIFTYANLALLRKEASSRVIHKQDEIEVWPIDGSFLDALEAKLERKTSMDLTRNEGRIYVTVGGEHFETEVVPTTLIAS